jgi:5-methylcytosine-specific restriction endonuclease McrA
MRECPHCHLTQPCENFQLAKSGNRSGWCRNCRSEKERQRRLAVGMKPRNASRIDGESKLCTGCHVFRPFSMFSPCERGLGGLSTLCSPCHAEKYRDTEKARAATAKYRKNNRERHLAMHRVNMFRRRSKKEALSDGTVTDSFLKDLYSKTHCSYCYMPVEYERRTADHIVPLNAGGLHSCKNLTMACFSCNSSKRDISADEFRGKLFKSKSWLKNYVDYYG